MGPAGLTIRANMDSEDLTKSRVESFLRLAGELIPVAKSSLRDEDESSKLKFNKRYCLIGDGIGDLISVCAYFEAELWIGWRVMKGTGFYDKDFTIEPYSHFKVRFNFSASTYPAEIAYEGALQLFDIKLPLSLSYGYDYMCLGAVFFSQGSYLEAFARTNLLQCQKSIRNSSPWDCDKVLATTSNWTKIRLINPMFLDIDNYLCISL
ncbi:unnamed protein product [Moneuplotes crassus]|uniref:Uncharacterized protein n=1 Tax=Euplotes crassus TaxID=5936 RepID=A0AAD1XGQ6_EUPCR|nr:unnamed protein product [Moneuplotes crassus]